MVNLEKQLKQLSKDFDIADEEVIKWWRDCVRGMWGNSIFKNKFIKESSFLVDNDNPRSMKRYPQVRKFKCAICSELFGSSQVEIDHKISENTLTDYSHAEQFMNTIMFTSPTDLQVLCKDTKKKVGGKNVVTRFGCHSIKTYSERYNMTFQEAKVHKQVIEICKNRQLVIDTISQFGVQSIPTTSKARRELLTKLMLTEINND